MVMLVVAMAALVSACSGPATTQPKTASDVHALLSVVDVSPNSGPTTGGTLVQIRGTGVSGTTKVMFGSVAALTFHVVSDTELTAISPPQSASIQTVSVTTPHGASAPGAINDQFTYDAPTPVVSAVTPASGPVGGGTLVTITGSGFVGAGKVRFGTVLAARFTVVSDSVIMAVTPAQLPGPHPVYVTTSGGSNALVTDEVEFRALSPVPTVTSVTPATGPTTGGTMVTITGSGFGDATKVAFGPLLATNFTVVSGTEITAVTPAQVQGTRPVYVITPAGRNSTALGSLFTFVASAPSVTAVTPSSGLTTGGTSVTLTGTGFSGATKVEFGAVPASSFTVVSATEIIAVTPAQRAGTRPVLVTTPLEGTNVPGGAPDSFTYTAAGPT